MPTEFLPAVSANPGPARPNFAIATHGQSVSSYFNTCPIKLPDGSFGIRPRPEFSDGIFAPTSSADRGRGVYAWADESSLYLTEDHYVYNGGSQDLKATTGNGHAGNTGHYNGWVGSWVEHLVSGVPNLVIINAGHTSTNASAEHGSIWYTADGTTAPTSLSDAQLPCNAGVSITRGGASLDGYFFVADITGKIYNSDLNDITAWSGDFLTAEREPDTGIYLGKHHDHVVYIGTKSIEFFYNAGNASGSPLARRQDVSYRVGCVLPNSILELGDIIYFVGLNSDGVTHIYMLNNFQLTVISDFEMDSKLASLGGGSNTSLTDLFNYERKAWLVNLPINQAEINYEVGLLLSTNTWSYFGDLSSGTWHYWSYNSAGPTYAGGLTDFKDNLPIVATNNYRTTLRTQFENGALGTPGSSAQIDDFGDGNYASIYLVFPSWTAGTARKKRIISARIIVKTQPSITNVQKISLRWYDADKVGSGGKPVLPTDFNTGKQVIVTTAGKRIFRLGTCHERYWMLDFDGDTSFAEDPTVIGLEIDYEIVGE